MIKLKSLAEFLNEAIDYDIEAKKIFNEATKKIDNIDFYSSKETKGKPVIVVEGFYDSEWEYLEKLIQKNSKLYQVPDGYDDSENAKKFGKNFYSPAEHYYFSVLGRNEWQVPKFVKELYNDQEIKIKNKILVIVFGYYNDFK